MSVDQGWLTNIRFINIRFYFHSFINLELDCLFLEWAALKFFNSACFLKFSPITKQYDTPEHHKIG